MMQRKYVQEPAAARNAKVGSSISLSELVFALFLFILGSAFLGYGLGQWLETDIEVKCPKGGGAPIPSTSPNAAKERELYATIN